MNSGSSTQETRGDGRAFGKVILFGEHAVVYGVPAIAAGISTGAQATAILREEDRIRVNGVQLEPSHELYRALGVLREHLDVPPVDLELIVDLPLGAGLGSSAAMAVSSARALGDLCGRQLSQRDVFFAAQAWEKVFHGNPSGIDVAAACSMGLIVFTKGETPEPTPLAQPLHLAIAQAGPPASTRLMVEGVARIRERNPVQFEKSLAAIASLSENGRLLLRQGDLQAVGKLMDLNQMLLAGWMLSTEEIETACACARDAGALGAKLTGAGGGGSVLALCETDQARKRVLARWESEKIACFSADVEVDWSKEHGHS